MYKWRLLTIIAVTLCGSFTSRRAQKLFSNPDFYILWSAGFTFDPKLKAPQPQAFRVTFERQKCVSKKLISLRVQVLISQPRLTLLPQYSHLVCRLRWGRLTGLLRWRLIISFRGHHPHGTKEQSALCTRQTKMVLWVQHEDLAGGHLSTRALSSWTISKISHISLFQFQKREYVLEAEPQRGR